MKIIIFIGLICVALWGSESKILPIESKVLDITSKVSEINQKVLSIKAKEREIKAFLKDLNVKVSKKEVKITMSADVLFDFDSAKLRKKSEEKLKEVADFIKQYKAKEVIVEGHTDSKGSDKYNMKLSLKRADSVKNWLVEKGGIDPNIIKTAGYGESKPIAPNTNKDGSDNPEGRQKNRRVEITVKR